jgi:undecaprenyl-diphosphatase
MLKYIILGIIQGLTEFLPVSSSAHLVIMQRILDMRGLAVIISVVLHLGTALALVIFFFKEILAILRNPKVLLLATITTLITAAIGVSGKKFFESLFESPHLVAFALIVTGIILILTRNFITGHKRNNLNLKDAIILGFTQGLAIIPGISRSGITISTLLFRRVHRDTSFSFAFIIAIPVILGAALYEAKDINSLPAINLHSLFIGFIFSFVTGILSLRILKIFMDKAKLHYFGYYCILVAVVTIIFLR